MEAVLDFGRGCQKWLKSCNGEYVGGGGGRNRRRPALLIAFIGGGVRGGQGGQGGERTPLSLHQMQLYAYSLHFVSLSHISVLLLQPLSI
jgi:hypothetical protein